MKVHLLFRDHDADLRDQAPETSAPLVDDLELTTLWDAMAAGDELVRAVSQQVILHPLHEPEQITYRQAVLADCRAHPDLLGALEQVAARAVTAERRASTWLFDQSPRMSLSHAVAVLNLLLDDLRELRTIAERHTDAVRSEGWRELLATIRRELDDDYLALLHTQVEHLRFNNGLVHSTHLGPTGLLTDLVLRRPRPENHRHFSANPLHRPTLSWTVPERDEAGSRALGELQDRALLHVAGVALAAAEHVKAFFEGLRLELAFYRGCLNLLAALEQTGARWCMPTPVPEPHRLEAAGLYDPCLVLRTGQPAVTNDISIDGQRLLVITGANHGGKSTTLRALGLLHLTAQAGAPVAAEHCTLSPVLDVHTHWAREEDTDLQRGKLDEELARLAQIVEHVRPGSLVLSNESLSSTNETEGAAIALDIVRALVDGGVKVYLVTHLYELSQPIYNDPSRTAVFLRAPRQLDNSTNYRLEPGPPLPTSFGRDLYQQVFAPVTTSGA